MNDYCKTAETLVDRIRALPRDRVLACADAWALFKIEGFECGDLAPSWAQASAALAQVKREAKP